MTQDEAAGPGLGSGVHVMMKYRRDRISRRVEPPSGPRKYQDYADAYQAEPNNFTHDISSAF